MHVPSWRLLVVAAPNFAAFIGDEAAVVIGVVSAESVVIAMHAGIPSWRIKVPIWFDSKLR